MDFLTKLTSTKSFLALLVCIGLLAYVPSWGNQFVWDDEQFIYSNVYVKQFAITEIFSTSTTAGAGIASNYFRPLTTLSFAVDHAIWGLNPFGFLVTNTFMHISSGVLLFLLLRILFISAKKQKPSLQSFSDLQISIMAGIVAVLFIVHPIQTEAVTYINSRGDSYSTLLTLAGLLSFAYSFHVTKKSTKYALFFLTLLLYPLSFLAKEIAVASIGLYVLIFWLPKKTSKLSWAELQSWIEILIGLGAVLLSYLFLRVTIWNFAEPSLGISPADDIDQTILSNQAASDTLAYYQNPLIRFFTFTKIFFVYIRLLFVPFPLHMERDVSIVTSFLNPWTFAFIALAIGLYFVARYEHKKYHSYWTAFGIGWFMCMLLPISGIVPINGLLYEHWLYVPQIGVWLCLVVWLMRFLNQYKVKTRALVEIKSIQMVLASGFVLVITLFAGLTIRQNYIWGDPIRFYSYTLQFAQTARLHNNLGMAYADKDMHDKAVEQYELALDLSNNYPHMYHNLGNTYAKLGEIDKAKESYSKALEIDPNFFFSAVALEELEKTTNEKN